MEFLISVGFGCNYDIIFPWKLQEVLMISRRIVSAPNIKILFSVTLCSRTCSHTCSHHPNARNASVDRIAHPPSPIIHTSTRSVENLWTNEEGFRMEQIARAGAGTATAINFLFLFFFSFSFCFNSSFLFWFFFLCFSFSSFCFCSCFLFLLRQNRVCI